MKVRRLTLVRVGLGVSSMIFIYLVIISKLFSSLWIASAALGTILGISGILSLFETTLNGIGVIQQWRSEKQEKKINC